MFPSFGDVFIALILVKLATGTNNPFIPASLYAVNVLGFGFFANTPMNQLLFSTTIGFGASLALYWLLVRKLKDMTLFWPVALIGAVVLGYL